MPVTECSMTAAERNVELLATRYAVLTEAADLPEGDLVSRVEEGMLKTGVSLVVALKRQGADYIPSATETAGQRFAAEILSNFTKNRTGVLEGQAYHLGQQMLWAMAWDGYVLPATVACGLTNSNQETA